MNVKPFAATCLALLALAPAASAQEGHCLTPVAPDGHEPPCNPALADSAWSSSHRGSYAQASTPYPGPAPGQRTRYEHTSLLGVPIVLDFSAPYADGGRAVWMSTVSAPDSGFVYKADFETGRVIDAYSYPTDESRGPGSTGSISGAYNLLDRDGHLIVGRNQALDVYGDSRPGDRSSPIALLRRFELPREALCRSTDRLVGINMLPDGLVAFATEQGVVGVVPRQPDRMTAEHLRTFSINGARCADSSVPAGDLETVSNSIAADEHGAIYTVTDAAQYRHSASAAGVQQVWRAEYETGAGTGVRLGDGSGSTPTLMGTDPGDDKFVVITDGQKLMHLVLMWRDEIPEDWEPIAPGKDRRIACEVPIRFGDPEATESTDEQSVLVRGYASILVNNQLRDADFLDALPPGQRIIAAALAGQSPAHAPHGLERIDWDPESRTCGTRWANRDVSIPNGIPSMSTATNLVYGIAQSGGAWGLEGVDFDTGESRLRVESSARPTDNSFYAATTVGPEGTVWTGTFNGLTVFRPPATPGPELACKDITPPSVRLGRNGRLAGRAFDRACGAPGRVARVEVALARRGEEPRWRRARGTSRWRLPRPAVPGRYRLSARAVDAAGNVGPAASRIVTVAD